MKQVSVVIPTFNKKALLARTLASLTLQDAPAGSFDVVVVDDGSSDGTGDVVRDKSPSGIVYERHPETRGRAASRNTGIRLATGETIVFLDDDMVVGPGFIRAHIDAHDQAKNRVVIGNVATAPEANGSPVSRYLDTRGVQKRRGRGGVPSRYFSTNNSSVRRSLLVSVGLFDERFVTYGFEDVDMGYMLEKSGAEFVFSEAAFSSHIHRHSLRELLEKKVLCGKSSLRILLAKHPELRKVLKIDLLDPLSFSGDGFPDILRKILLRVFMKKPFYRAGFYLGEHLPPGRVAFAIIDFLVFYSYAEGLRTDEG